MDDRQDSGPAPGGQHQRGGRPVLVRLDEDAGHGIGSTREQRFAEQADVFSFFLAVAGEAGFGRR